MICPGADSPGERGEMNKLERINDVLEKAIKEIRQVMNELEAKEIELSGLNPGDRFDTEIGKFIVLGHENGVTKVVQDDFFEKNVKFDDNSCDYTKSKLKKMFDEKIAPAYEKVFGYALVEHEVELKSVDMQDYGKFKCKVRPMTFDEAREFNPLIVKQNIGAWWWLCTPWSTKERGWQYQVTVVSPSGCISRRYDYRNGLGVRPFCILKSNIFVSKK